MHLDMNLLIALDALLDEGGVGAAADRLHLSQPAMSRTLARLRRATGDEILVRSGRVMLPTPYALAVRDEVHALVTRAEAIFTPSAEVDPATLARTFTLQCNDAIAEALIPRLTARLAASAPGVCLRVLGESLTSGDELRRGTVDVRLADEVAGPADVRSATVVSDRLVYVTSAPGAALTDLPHVVISRRGRRRDRLDDLMAPLGLTRTVAAVVPTVGLALRTVAAAPMITVVPAAFTADLLPASLRAYPLPFETPALPVIMAWHLRHDRDPGHRWLRSELTSALSV